MDIWVVAGGHHPLLVVRRASDPDLRVRCDDECSAPRLDVFVLEHPTNAIRQRQPTRLRQSDKHDAVMGAGLVASDICKI